MSEKVARLNLDKPTKITYNIYRKNKKNYYI